MSLIPDYAYKWVYIIACTILCIKHSIFIKSYPSFGDYSNREDGGNRHALWLLIATCLFFGLRPISTIFSDMVGYAETYEYDYFLTFFSESRNEPLWRVIQYVCKYYIGLNTNLWFLAVAIIAFGLKYAACRKICGNHIYTLFLFLLTSFSCWSNGVVIIRSHIGMALAMYGFALFLDGTYKHIAYSLVFFALAYYTHTSSALLILCFLVSRYVITSVKWSVFIYVACIGLSLVMGSYFEEFFSSLGFDDRMRQFTTDVDYEGFAHTGFRWDFLAYSVVPIILGWIIIVNKKITDRTYSCLLNTYILSNAFWVLVIRAQFSDRFAAISWTLYFLVLAYPLLKFNIWNNQLNKVSLGLWFQMGFLWLMQLYYALR